MMKTKHIFYAGLFAACAAGTLASCYDDEGNYDYKELDEVTISTEGTDIQEAYVLDRYDTLSIAPDVYYNGKKVSSDSDAPLDYLWTMYSVASGVGIDYTIDTLATTRALDAEISRVAGSYYVQLTVTNREDGIESYFRTTLSVEESITAGWMMLYERADQPGKSDVGLVVNPLVKKNIIKNKEFWNLYSASNGAPLEGTPVRLLHETIPLGSGGTPRIATTKEFVSVNNGDFVKIQDWADFFYSAPAKGNISYFGCNKTTGMSETLIVDNTLYTLIGNTSTGVGYFGVPKQDGGLNVGELAPWCSNMPRNLEAVVYDQTNGRFLFIPTSGTTFKQFGNQSEAAKFDVNNTDGMKLLYGDWGASFRDYLLFSKGNSRYLGVANFYTANATLANIGVGFYDVSDSPEIQNATAFAASYVGQYVYYSAGNKVYDLAYSSGSAATAIWTAPSADETVTAIATQKYYFSTLLLYGMVPNSGKVLHIATWNDKTQEGKLYEYAINSASGTIDASGESYEYTVPGKVKDMGWKIIMEM
jgi:hypothetical protein